MRGKEWALGLAVLFLSASSIGCGSDLCEEGCDCTQNCSDKEVEECQHALDVAEREAESQGCDDVYSDYLSCLEDVSECIGDEFYVDGCTKESEALSKCVDD